MKLRIRGNSVRVRLTQSEVAILGAGKSVEQVTEFTPTNALRSRVRPTAQVQHPTVTFDGGCLSVLLPLDGARAWAQSDQVGIEGRQTVTAGKSLEILVEKDFECLHSKAEEDADAFPNPRSA